MALIALAACGSDDEAADTTTASATAPAPTAPAATDAPTTPAATDAPETTAPEETTAPTSDTTPDTADTTPDTTPDTEESTPATEVSVPPTDPGPATGDPIKIGFVNLEGGAISLPELRIGAETAAAYVNEHGGAGGRPLEIIPCNADLTPEKSIDCANQLIEEGVVLVFEGYDPNSDAMLPVLDSAGVALTGHAAFGPQQQVADNAFFLGTANPSFTAGFLDYYASSGAESMMLFLPDNAAFRDSADTIVEPVADSLDFDVNITFYDPSAPGFDALATTALAENPDVVGTVAPDGDCLGLLGALRAVQYPGEVFLGACSLFLVVDPANAVGVTTVADLWKPTDLDAPPPEKVAELQLYIDTMTAAGHEDLIPGFAWDYFSDTVNISRILGTIEGDVTPEAVSDAFRSTVDLDSFMGPTISCDHSAWPGESACGNKVLLYRVEEGGTQTAITPDFIDTSVYIELLG